MYLPYVFSCQFHLSFVAHVLLELYLELGLPMHYSLFQNVCLYMNRIVFNTFEQTYDM